MLIGMESNVIQVNFLSAQAGRRRALDLEIFGPDAVSATGTSGADPVSLSCAYGVIPTGDCARPSPTCGEFELVGSAAARVLSRLEKGGGAKTAKLAAPEVAGSPRQCAGEWPRNVMASRK